MIDGKKAVFLDRDGTINVEKNYLYRQQDFEYLPGAVEGMKALLSLGFILVIVTNQSGIARGYYSEDDYLELDRWLKEDLKSKGIELAGTYYCPHLPDGAVIQYRKECECRKPKTGLFWRAQRELGIDMDKSFAVGDKVRDLSVCKESGVKGILLTDMEAAQEGIRTCETWDEVVETIRSLSKD